MEKVIVDDDADEALCKNDSSKDKQDNSQGENQEEQQEEQTKQEKNEGNSQTLPMDQRYVSSYLKDLILRDPSRGLSSSVRNTCEHAAFMSQIEPKLFLDVENDESWIIPIQKKS